MGCIMSKLLDGKEIAGYVKERQAKQVRALRQAHHVFPKLAIIQTIDSAVIDTYVRMKKRYGEDILIDVEIFKIDQSKLKETIQKVNNDSSFHGMIVQLPLADKSETEDAVNLVTEEKDVDGLSAQATLTPATPLAIMWLLAGYNVELAGKKIAIVGKGRLVGAPLIKIWGEAGYELDVIDSSVEDRSAHLRQADIIVTATGVPGLIKSNDVKIGAVVVDAGTASEHGKIVGDVDDEVRERDDVTITPLKGGVGPLTVAALFENVIQAATKTIEKVTGED
jgi:methylenetetrahydrofolate dehydrogenase (NADP+) / methenyltetrahydrofolate cyclohydrolase